MCNNWWGGNTLVPTGKFITLNAYLKKEKNGGGEPYINSLSLLSKKCENNEQTISKQTTQCYCVCFQQGND